MDDALQVPEAATAADPQRLTRLLLYGRPETRRQLAERLARARRPEVL